ncbi:metallophosphoesterase [Halorutilales archaeon Cl-col2-1]
MRVGIISDVHGNAPALESVLRDMEVDRVIHAGDVVGYNPYPTEVIDVFRERGVKSIKGNHDRAVAGGSSFGFHSVAGRAVDWTRDRLSDDDLEYIESLPVEKDIENDGVNIHIAHGAPDAPDRYTRPHEFSPNLIGDEDVLVLGHTHVQHSETFDEGTIVNPGSVGQPRDGDPRAAYAILDTEEVEVDLRRVEYPIEEVDERIEDVGLPPELGNRLYEGR